MTRDEVVGLVPAAGRARRLAPFSLPKELIPVAVSEPAPGAPPRLRVLCEYALDQLRAAGVPRAVVVIGDHKFDVLRHLGDGAAVGLDLAYVHQAAATGLPGAVDCARAWTRDRTTALVMPDTIAAPATACGRALAELERSGADVVLGLFPTDRPEALCPVELDAAGRVTALHDKVAGIRLANTWGLVVWRPTFARFLHQALAAIGEPGREVTLAEILTGALDAGLDLRGVAVPGGRYLDLGTPEALRDHVFAPADARAAAPPPLDGASGGAEVTHHAARRSRSAPLEAGRAGSAAVG